MRHGLGAQGLGGRVQVRVTSERDAVRVEVTDDGPGFPREMLSAQGNPELGHPGGVGMAIVRERLEALFGPGHTLHLENAEPHGARVWFTLPAGAAGVSEVRA
ncbi:sensor histidine kinase [Alicyclobacillus macrosporangiidus]|uniref:sensor histidine kinase n=1 Tax=Alicyclobacillus macrosporangiidus TaxID=392015 RepID=UPI00068E259B|nr:ATP-binding protein [Alicyclobacillus macrosporangiidus]